MLSPRVDLFAECDSAPPGHILSGLSFLTPTVSGAQMEDGGLAAPVMLIWLCNTLMMHPCRGSVAFFTSHPPAEVSQ